MDTNKWICIIGPILMLFIVFMQTGYWRNFIRRLALKKSSEKRDDFLMAMRQFGIITQRQYELICEEMNPRPKQNDPATMTLSPRTRVRLMTRAIDISQQNKNDAALSIFDILCENESLKGKAKNAE
jgi:hypothetical protein